MIFKLFHINLIVDIPENYLFDGLVSFVPCYHENNFSLIFKVVAGVVDFHAGKAQHNWLYEFVECACLRLSAEIFDF